VKSFNYIPISKQQCIYLSVREIIHIRILELVELYNNVQEVGLCIINSLSQVRKSLSFKKKSLNKINPLKQQISKMIWNKDCNT